MKNLKPAILYKEEIEKRSKELYYSEDLFYYTGGRCHTPITIAEESKDGGRYQWAIVDNDQKLMGYISYYIDYFDSCASSFGLFSFEPGNPFIGIALKEVIHIIKDKHKLHRAEFRCIGGNKVQRHYDTIITRYHGNCVILHDVFKDVYGEYHDELIYEIILDRDVFMNHDSKSYYVSEEFKERVKESKKIAEEHFIDCTLGYRKKI